MLLYLAHAMSIHDVVTMVAVPLSLLPNVMIASVLVRRRLRVGPQDRVAQSARSTR